MWKTLTSLIRKKRSHKENIFIQGRQLSVEELNEFIYRWNLDHPIDYWWRQKHKIIFNSVEHRAVSFFDMYVEKTEDNLYKRLFSDTGQEKYIPGNSFLKKKEIEQVLSEEEFENIDLSQFDD